jgi:hypothetical protein
MKLFVSATSRINSSGTSLTETKVQIHHLGFGGTYQKQLVEPNQQKNYG